MVRSVAVVANCQVTSYARCFKALAQGVEVVPVPLAKAGSEAECETLAARALACDIVFCQPHEHELGPLGVDALRASARRFELIPAVAFWGFHPDAVRLAGGKTWAPVVPFHSMLAIGAFLHGLPPERALSLLNTLVFRRLGYFEAYDRALAQLRRYLGDQGFGAEDRSAQWLRAGPFMHAPNHPNMAIVGDLARKAAERAGLGIDASADLAALPDPLARAANYPVYPELARRLGVDSDGMHRPGPNDETGPLTREEFVRRSYAIYATVERPVMEAAVRKHVRDFFATLG